VGVVEIKKHQKNVLEMPTVLGELFDQMILVEGFYMSGPVIGILTTLEDWLFCWFPADTAHFSSELEPYIATSAFLTPQKGPAPAGASTSPPRDTPSRRNHWSHGVELSEDDREDPDVFALTEEVIERALHTSPVINAYSQYDLLLQYLCSAFTRFFFDFSRCRKDPQMIMFGSWCECGLSTRRKSRKLVESLCVRSLVIQTP